MTASEQGLQDIAEQVDRAIAAAERLEPEARAAAGALRAALEQFHKVGLTTIVARLKADPRGKQLLFDLVDEPEVRALLSLHGLIRASATSDAVPTPPLPAAPPPPKPAPISAVIPLSALKARGSATPAPRVEQGWLPGPALEEIAETRPYRLDVRDTSLVLVRQGGRVQAYRNECAHQGLPIDGGIIDRESGTITCPWHGFRFDCATGECLTAPHVQLEAVPSRVDGGIVHVKVE